MDYQVDMLNYLHDNNHFLQLKSSVIDHALEKLQLLPTSEKVDFLMEQLSLLYSKPNGRRYSQQTLSKSVIWNDISPALYRQILADNILTLPSTRHNKRLGSALKTDLDLADSSIKYLTVRKEKLASKDLKVSIFLDEVHSQMKVQYQNGKFYGWENGQATKTLLCTMLKSVAGKYRDIVTMSPVVNINADKIHQIWCNLLKVLTTIGFDVQVTMNDGHASNVNFFEKLIGKSLNVALTESHSCGIYTLNPYDTNKKIFLAFDPTHIFKNFYNNFQTYKVFHYPSFTNGEANPDLLIQANFDHLQELYNIERAKPERKAYKLTYKLLHPNSIEKSSAQLAVGCFHQSTINALKYYAKKGYPEFSGTAEFLQIIHNWFSVFNVKSLFAGQKSRDPYQTPIRKGDGKFQYDFFDKFLKWLTDWESSSGRGLSRQTFQAAKVTTLSIKYLIKQLLEDPLIEFVLLGLISSDYLESRFGWFRQLCGADYFNAVLQFLQAERKIRLRMLVQQGLSVAEIKAIFDDSEAANRDSDEISSSLHFRT